MKAIYTILNRTVCRIDQDTSVPTDLAPIPLTTHSTVHVDEVMLNVGQHIYLNLLNDGSFMTKSNKERYEAFCNYLKRELVTEIETLKDKYQVAIDYTMKNCCGEEIHNIMLKPLTVNDVAVLLGVGANNELVYKRAKKLTTELEFALTNTVPVGIMSPGKGTVEFRVNNLTIYQDASAVSGSAHNSIYCCCYQYDSPTVVQTLKNWVPIYSTRDDDSITFENIRIKFTPRKISLELIMFIGNIVVAYDDGDINRIIEENIEKKYNPPQPTPPDTGEDDDGKVIPDSELYPDADGSEEPDENGWFDYYELCRSTTPCALQVVEDLIPATVYDSHKMIKKNKVIKDIPNVTIGDFVIYRTAAVHNNPEAVDDGSNDEGCPVSTGDDEEPVVIDITDTDL